MREVRTSAWLVFPGAALSAGLLLAAYVAALFLGRDVLVACNTPVEMSQEVARLERIVTNSPHGYDRGKALLELGGLGAESAPALLTITECLADDDDASGSDRSADRTPVSAFAALALTHVARDLRRQKKHPWHFALYTLRAELAVACCFSLLCFVAAFACARRPVAAACLLLAGGAVGSVMAAFLCAGWSGDLLLPTVFVVRTPAVLLGIPWVEGVARFLVVAGLGPRSEQEMR